MAGEINIYGTINSMTGDGKAVKAHQTFDETLNKFQSDINQDALMTVTEEQFNAIFN